MVRMGGTGKKGLFAYLCLLLLGVGVVLGDDGAPADPPDENNDSTPADEGTPEPPGHATKCYLRQFGGTINNRSCDHGDRYCVTFWDTEYGQESRDCTSDQYTSNQWKIDAHSTVCSEVKSRYKEVDRYVCLCKSDLCNNNKFGHSQYKAFIKAQNGGGGDNAHLDSSGARTFAMTLTLTLTAAILAY